ncbi:uncharacterized protein LOC144132880 isoform X2 [Amblyomma americanum]
MKPVTTIIFLVLGVASLAAAQGDGLTSAASCDFSDLDVRSLVQATVDRLPEKYTPPYLEPQEILPGLTIGSVVYSNLNDLKPYGAPLPYCHDGSRFVQVDLAATRGELFATVPWKYCGGKAGEASSRAEARVTVIFKVVESSGGNGTKLVHYNGPNFANLRVSYVRLDGAGDILGAIFGSMAIVLPKLPEAFWNDLLIFQMRNLHREIS